MKLVFIILNLWEKQRTEHGYWKVELHPKLQGDAASRRRYFTQYCLTQWALRYRNHARQERASWGNAAETVLLETNKIQKTSPNPRHVWNQTSSWWRTCEHTKLVQVCLSKENKLCKTLPTPWILHHVIFFFSFQNLRKSLTGSKFNSCPAFFRRAIFQCSEDHIPKG